MHTNIAERKLKHSGLGIVCCIALSSQSPCDLNSTVHILWMKKLRFTDVIQFIVNNRVGI